MASRLNPDLLDGLIDDAAVFPPGLAPLPRAVADHVARQAYRRYVGPLLVPATATADVRDLTGGAPIRLGLIARPGSPVEPVRAGALLLQDTAIEVSGVEVGAASDWAGLTHLGVPVTVEIPREGRDAALDAVAEAHHRLDRAPLVQAKLRTGATDTWDWPDEAEVARFILDCRDRALPFKLTGGLHHVLRADHADGPQHGLLNVLAAVAASGRGEQEDALVPLLGEREPDPLVALLTTIDEGEVAAVRRAFTAYGCCDVLDPVRELATLGLIPTEDSTINDEDVSDA